MPRSPFNSHVNHHIISNIIYYILLEMSSESLSRSLSSVSISASDASGNSCLNLVLVPANSHQPCSTRRQIVSAPAALGGAPTFKQTAHSRSDSSISDTSATNSTIKGLPALVSATPVAKGEKKCKSKSSGLSKPELDWVYQNIYTTRSKHGKATIGAVSGAPKGCEIM